MPREMLAGPDARWKRARSNATRSAMKHRTVRSVTATEVPPLDAALKAFAFADPGNIHQLANFEVIHQNSIPWLGFILRIGNSKFADISQRSDTSLLEVPGHRFVHPLRLDELDQSQLHCVVAIFVFRPPLHYHARAGLQHGARNRRAVFGEYLRHAKFYSEYSVDRHFVRSFFRDLNSRTYLPACSRPKALISTSTPGGKSNFISASTVSGVGSRMSISRLCVRISNCSRDFLSTCGERKTVQRLIVVGKGMGPATSAPVRFAVSTISRVDWSRIRWS